MKFNNEETLSKTTDSRKRKLSAGNETHYIPTVKLEPQVSSGKIKSSFPLSQHEDPQNSTFCSIKYIDVSKDRIGDLSKRVVWPLKSNNDKFKDIKLPLNYSLNSKRMNKINYLKYNSENSIQEYTQSREHVIHNYALPNALVSTKRPRRQNPKQSPLTITKIRAGVSGWKLTGPCLTNRPETYNISNLETQGSLHCPRC